MMCRYSENLFSEQIEYSTVLIDPYEGASRREVSLWFLTHYKSTSFINIYFTVYSLLSS
jgi:hypothetical protein